MFSLLSRFAWIISILMSLSVWSSLFTSFGDSFFRILGFFGWILVFFGAAIIKKIFLSEDSIRTALIGQETSIDILRANTEETFSPPVSSAIENNTSSSISEEVSS